MRVKALAMFLILSWSLAACGGRPARRGKKKGNDTGADTAAATGQTDSPGDSAGAGDDGIVPDGSGDGLPTTDDTTDTGDTGDTGPTTDDTTGATTDEGDTGEDTGDDEVDCIPQCAGADCGPDGCGGSCGTCDVGTQCSDEGLCEFVCTPQCNGVECGSDGCGGSCGSCGEGAICSEGECIFEELGPGDSCETAFEVDSIPFSISGNTKSANKLFSFVEGACPGNDNGWGGGSKDHVYEFTPPTTGAYKFDLVSQFDSVLYVSAACGEINETCLGADEQACTDCLETVTVDLEAGDVVFVYVDGYSNSSDNSGQYELEISKVGGDECIPACGDLECGDDGCGGSCGACGEGASCMEGQCIMLPDAGDGDTCETAQLVADLPFTTSGSNASFNNDYWYSTGKCPPETGGYGKGSKDVVYAYTPQMSGSVNVQLTSQFDSNLYVVTDCGAIDTSCVAGDEDACSNCTETVTFNATAGVVYYVIVDGYSNGSGTSGSYTLKISP